MSDDLLDDLEVPGLKYATRTLTPSAAPSKGPSVVVTSPEGNSFNYPSAKKIDLENLNPDLLGRLELARKEWKDQFGTDLPITSGRRTREEQYKQYQARLAGAKNTGFMAINPDDQPGRQFFHENAVDVHPSVPNQFLEKFGLHRPFGSKDPVHVEINPKIDFKLPEPAFSEDDISVPGLKYAKPGQFKPIEDTGFAEDFRKTVKDMSWEDWKKKSLIAPAAQYVVGGLPIIGDPEMKAEAQKILEEKGKGFVEGVKTAFENPVETAKNIYTAVKEHPGQVVGEMVKGAVYDPELLLLPGVKQTAQMVQKGAKATTQAAAKVPGMVREAVMPSEQQLIQQFAQRKGGGSVGAMSTPDRATIDTMIQGASPELQDFVRQTPPELVNVKALENQLKGDKFGYRLTEGEALQDAAKMSDEYNKRAKHPELLERLQDRDAKISQGFQTLRERAAPDIYTGNMVDMGQTAIDQLLIKDKARLQDINTKYQALEAANGGQFPIDTNKLKTDIDSMLSKKVLRTFAESNMRPYLKDLEDFQKRGTMSFDEFENLRTNMAEEMRSNPNGNARRVAGIIRQELENLPMSEALKDVKPLADAARAAVRERYQVLDSNPAYRVAVKDTRLDKELAEGLEHVAADKFIKKFVVNGETGNVKRLMGELGDNTLGHQAVQAGLIKFLEEASVNSKGVVSQAAFNSQLEKTIGKKLFDVMPNQVAVDLKDLADLARLTEHAGGKGYANLSNTVPTMMRESAATAAEVGLNMKTGLPIGSWARKKLESATEGYKIKKSLGAGAGVKTPIKDLLKDLESEGK